MPELKMLENILKLKKSQQFMLESTFREDWDEIGTNRAKKAVWCLKVPFFRSLLGVNGSKLGIQSLHVEINVLREGS